MDIRSLHHEGHSIKAIARYTGRSRNTVRRVLREAAPAAFHKPERHSQLDPYKSYLRQLRIPVIAIRVPDRRRSAFL